MWYIIKVDGRVREMLLVKWLCLLVAFVGSVFVTPVKAAAGSSILAVVDNEPITSLDVEKTLKLLQIFSQTKCAVSNAKNVVLESLIQDKVRAAYAMRIFRVANQNPISDNDVAEEFANMSMSYGVSPEQFVKILRDQKADVATIKEQIKNRLIWTAYLNAKYGSLIEPSSQEVRAYQERLKESYKKKAYKVERLFFPFRAFSNDRSRTRECVNKAVALLNTGLNFEILSRTFAGVTSSLNNGDYGFIAVGQLPFAEENAKLACMHMGETAVVESKFGLSIIRVGFVRASSDENRTILTFKYVIKPTVNQGDIQQDFAEIANFSKNCKDANDMIDKASKKGYDISEKNEACVDDLHNDIRQILDKMKTGTFSQPIVTPEGILVVCLLKKENFRIAPPDYKECKMKLYEDKLNAMADRESRDANNAVFVKRCGLR